MNNLSNLLFFSMKIAFSYWNIKKQQTCASSWSLNSVTGNADLSKKCSAFFVATTLTLT